MTLDAFSWLGIFVGVFGFLIFCAHVLETWPRTDPMADQIERRLDE